jgi:hypothetical protein
MRREPVLRKILRQSTLACLLVMSGCATSSSLNEFTSDGCSLFPDGTLKNPTLWCDCCFNHDMAYWQGGSKQDREAADKALRACVIERTGDHALAQTMYEGVRVGGSPAFPTWYRWGYGWKYGRGYTPLTMEEQKQARDLLDAYRKKHPAGFCRKP